MTSNIIHVLQSNDSSLLEIMHGQRCLYQLMKWGKSIITANESDKSEPLAPFMGFIY